MSRAETNIVLTRQQQATELIPRHGTFRFARLYRLANRELIVLPRFARSEGSQAARGGRRGRSLAVSRRSRLQPAKKAPPAVALSFDPLSTFTPANADPKLAAAFGGSGPVADRFQIHACRAKSRPSQVRVAIRARGWRRRRRLADAMPRSASPVTALTPASYNLGVAVGWRRFAVVRRCRQDRDRRSGHRRPRKRGRRRQLLA